VPTLHPLCPLPVANIACLGVIAVLTLGTGCTKRGASGREQPVPAEFPQLRVLWSVSGEDIYSGGWIPLDPTGTVFLLDPERHAPFALSVKTGRRLWAAEADPKVPVAPSSPYSVRTFDLSLADKVLVLGTTGYVAAYRTDDGKRLWSRSDPRCHAGESGGHNLRLLYRKKSGFTDRIVNAATGEDVAVVEPTPVDKRATYPKYRVTLGRDVFLVARDNETKLEGRPLRAGLPSWRVELPPKSIDDGESDVRILFVDGVFIWLGGPMIALDESTGRRLWERTLSRPHREEAAGDMLLVMEGNGLVKLDARSGAVREQYLVPSLPNQRAPFRLLASGDRVALVEEVWRHWELLPLGSENGYVVAWTAGAPAPIISLRPARTSAFALVGDVLLAAPGDDDQLFALDLPRH